MIQLSIQKSINNTKDTTIYNYEQKRKENTNFDLICARKGKNIQEIITTTQQANNPNNEVPPKDAQLQGVSSMASTQLQTQTRSASTRCATSRGER
jgi:hypothetical protein